MATIRSELDTLLQEAVDTIDLIHSVLYRTNQGLIVLRSADDHIYSVKDIKENHEAIKALSGNRKAYILNIAGKYTNIEPDVRDYVASGPHVNIIAAEAFVIGSLAQKLIANFYYRVNKPIVKTAFFTDITKAKNWLLYYRERDLNKI
ncbi:MAG: DUF7793 family protein [Bacteroidia bacterium]